MAREYFVISDLHLQHENIRSFADDKGNVIRVNPLTGKPFESVDHHDDYIISAWNSVVKPKNTVYVLGDVLINAKGYIKFTLLNGRKILVPGNHDIFHVDRYREHFSDVRGCIVKNNVIFTHIPVHKDCMNRFLLNVHGHTHANVMKINNIPDKQYYNVSVERLPLYQPIHIDVIYAARDKVQKERDNAVNI